MAIHNLVTENYLRLNFAAKSGVTPGTDDIIALNCNDILARYNVTISPSTTNYCPKQSELSSSVVNPPLVTTYGTLSSIASTSATASGYIMDSSLPEGTTYGLCWTPILYGNPSITDNVVYASNATFVPGLGIMSFSASMTGLSTGTHYYVRAFTKIGSNVNYGSSVEFMPSSYTIGTSLFGGRVFSILTSGDAGYDPNIQHGLIAYAYTLDYNRWSPDINIADTGIGVTDGAVTTARIMAAVSGESAARDCYDFGIGWYLPSVVELTTLRDQLSTYTALSNNIYDTSYPVWSSNASGGDAWGNHYAWVLAPNGNFIEAGVTSGNKSRPIRKF